MMKNNYLVIGLMSGSSLDGIDLAAAEFTRDFNSWQYAFKATQFVPYAYEWKNKLREAYHADEATIARIDKDYGVFLGETVSNFIRKHQLKPDFISSHGHTLFHQPEAAFTLQIGHGQTLADHCGYMVINDFRSEDVAKGGQGAPLVPIGDQLLFSDYDCCLNIGGIANLSVERKGSRLAYDICIANQALNFIAALDGREIDFDGKMAASGSLITELYDKLEAAAYFKQPAPKSLGREFFESRQLPHLTKQTYQPADLAHTYVQHLVSRISAELKSLQVKTVLLSGGGAFNTYLVNQLRQLSKAEIIVPDRRLVEYKEALVFAFLGVMKIRGEVNVLASVTGADSDSSSGKIWYPALGNKIY